MLNRFYGLFGSEGPNAEEKSVSNNNNNNIETNAANQTVLGFVENRLWDPYSICEVDCVVRVGRHLLSKLDPDMENFDRQLDAIVFGTMVGAKVAASMHGTAKLTYCDLPDDEFQAVFGGSYLGSIAYREDNQQMCEFLMGLGERVLDGRLPFDAKLIDVFDMLKDVDFLERLNVYRPEIVAEDQELTTREKKLIELLQQERAKTKQLSEQLAKANEKQSSASEKLEAHQREKMFKQLDEVQSRKHRMPPVFRRK